MWPGPTGCRVREKLARIARLASATTCGSNARASRRLTTLTPSTRRAMFGALAIVLVGHLAGEDHAPVSTAVDAVGMKPPAASSASVTPFDVHLSTS